MSDETPLRDRRLGDRARPARRQQTPRGPHDPRRRDRRVHGDGYGLYREGDPPSDREHPRGGGPDHTPVPTVLLAYASQPHFAATDGAAPARPAARVEDR